MSDIVNELIHEIHASSTNLKSDKVSKISLHDIDQVLSQFKRILFPGVFHSSDEDDLSDYLDAEVTKLIGSIVDTLCRLAYSKVESEKLTAKIIQKLPQLRRVLTLDITAIYVGDPAADSHEEVVLAYPSFEAIMIYRIAHELSLLKLNLLARISTSIAHRNTGIDIHPRAKIGQSFCIDHGTGVVIGETSIIGNNVKLYQGVTIGALSVSKSHKGKKRHPTIEDNVTIYARTTVLGGETVIGENSIIGGNVWLTRSVKKNSKIYNKGVTVDDS